MSQATLTSGPYRNSNLFSSYYLGERVSDLEAWDCDSEAEAAFEQIRNLWEKEGSLLPSYNEEDLINIWIAPIVGILGHGTSSEVTLPNGGGYVDKLLFENDEVRREAAKLALDGEDEGLFSRASAILEAKQWGRDFEQRFAEQRSYRDASHQIKYYLERTPSELNWGVLTNGKKWRLYGTKDYETQTYYEIDLPEILGKRDLEAFKYFFTFFRSAAFRGTAGTTFLDTVWNESETAAQELGEDLQDNVFIALRVLGEGFVETNDLQIGPENSADIGSGDLKKQSLVLLYRLMFILYAESRGLVVPEELEAKAEYEANFSLDQLRLDIHDRVSSGDSYDDYSEYSTTIWSQLQDLFSLVDTGSDTLGVPPYNGGLFDADGHEFLAHNQVADPYIAEIIHRLGTTEDENGELVIADYADIDTRHLGTIYEGLLEHEFRIAPEEYAAVTADGGQIWKPAKDVSVADAVESVDEGSLYVVNDDGERKATGAYYTPDYVVSYIVEETIEPLLDGIRTELEADGLKTSDQAYFGRFYSQLLDLKVLDPAMGSAHFLTSATGYLTEQAMQIVREQELQGRNEQELRRTIAKECIYGVDINGMAVELGKLSMWLETLAADKPLAFLDHHIKTGNSLIGSDISEVLSEDSGKNGGQLTLTQSFARARQQTLSHVMDLMEDLLAIDNSQLSDIKSMENLYDEIRDDSLYQRLFEIANVHTAELFGLDVPQDVYQEMAGAIDDGDEWEEIRSQDWFAIAQATADDQNFFHWELEYPEVFFGEDGERHDDAGFDAVIGNPPYVSNWELTGIDENLPEKLEYIYPNITYGHWDLFVPFTYKGIQLTNTDGSHAFITPNSLATEKYGKKLREFLIEEQNLTNLVQFRDHSVFNDVDRQFIISITGNPSKIQNECCITKYEKGKFRRVGTVNPKLFLEYSNATFRLEIVNEDLNIKNKLESKAVQLGHLCVVNPGVVAHSASDSPLDFKKADVIDDQHHEGWKKYLSGKDIDRYQKDWEGKYMDYDSKSEHFHRPKFPELFDSPKIMFSGISGKKARIKSCYDNEEYYTNHNVFHATLWREDIEEHHSSMDYETDEAVGNYDIKYISAVVNSKLINYYFQTFLATGTLQGSYSSIYPEDIRKLPIFEIDFELDNSISDHGDFDSLKIGDIDLVNSSYQSALIRLADQMLNLHHEHSDLNFDLFDHLGKYSDGQSPADIGLTHPPKDSADSILQETTEQKPNLRVGEGSVVRESDSTVKIQLTARFKPEDKDAYGTDRWGYTETDPLPALRITDLTKTEADLIEAFVPVAIDEAGGFAGFRETATKTKSLVDRLHELRLPVVSDVEKGLKSYTQTKERAEVLQSKIEQIDGLINKIVYRLYGLTDDEIEVVEEAVNSP